MPSVRSRWLQNRISPSVAAVPLDGVGNVGEGLADSVAGKVADAFDVKVELAVGAALDDAVAPHPDTATAAAATNAGMARATWNLVMADPSCGDGSA